jgi:hypothetical protein
VNEPTTAPDAEPADDYAMQAANSALVDLEVNKDAENPFRVQAKAAIARGDTVCHDVARSQGQIYDNVKHMPWFIDAVAEELEANQDVNDTISNAFAYANDETPVDGDDGDENDAPSVDDGYHECLDCEGEFADEDCHAVDKGFVCEGCYRKRGPTEEVRQAVYAERIAAGLSPAEAAGHAWPENKEDEELLRRELADDAINEATAAALYARPMEMTIEVDPENILDGSDPRDQKLGEQSRQIAKLTQDLKEANNATAYHQRLYESRQRTSGQLSNTVSQLQEEIREWQSEDRKKARRIRDLETILRASATYITKHRPRQPTAKSKNFDALAEQLMAAADKDKKPKAVAKPAAKKAPAKKKR